MAKIHPNAVAAPPEPGTPGATGVPGREEEPPTVLTVWRKSLLFNCDGFTVYDASGDLAFRVDCYAASRSRTRRRRDDDVVLMDAAGKPLLTVRRKSRLVVAERSWVIYDGDAADTDAGAGKATPLLSVRRHAGRRLGATTSACKTLARVATAAASAYVVEGSYGQRACAVRDAARGGAVVAEVQRKEAVGDDVFRLVVPGTGLGPPMAMALVIALDDMFRGCAGAGAGAGGWSARSLLRRTLSSV